MRLLLLLLLLFLDMLRNDGNLLRQTCSGIRLADALEDGCSLDQNVDKELVEASVGKLDTNRGGQQSIQGETVLARCLVLARQGEEDVDVGQDLSLAAASSSTLVVVIVLAVCSKEVGHGLLVVTFLEENVAQTFQGRNLYAKASVVVCRCSAATVGTFQDANGRLEGAGGHVYLVVLEVERANLDQKRRYVDGTRGWSGVIGAPVAIHVSNRRGYLKFVV